MIFKFAFALCSFRYYDPFKSLDFNQIIDSRTGNAEIMLLVSQVTKIRTLVCQGSTTSNPTLGYAHTGLQVPSSSTYHRSRLSFQRIETAQQVGINTGTRTQSPLLFNIAFTLDRYWYQIGLVWLAVIKVLAGFQQRKRSLTRRMQNGKQQRQKFRSRR
ncbi:hypothetical protein C8R43DRAFT_1127560 [Mycena crocata]|nr:hypothetical protein C8R43DRAFT_1127560 [Mycena crocata]